MDTMESLNRYQSGAPAREDGLILGFETSHRRRKSLLTKTLDRLGFDFVCGGFEYIQRNIDEVVDRLVYLVLVSL